MKVATKLSDKHIIWLVPTISFKSTPISMLQLHLLDTEANSTDLWLKLGLLIHCSNGNCTCRILSMSKQKCSLVKYTNTHPSFKFHTTRTLMSNSKNTCKEMPMITSWIWLKQHFVYELSVSYYTRTAGIQTGLHWSFNSGCMLHLKF